MWTRVALQSFGGPAGQIAVMHRILVDEKRWIGEERFLYALNYCVLLPGPEAQQLATYIGWLLHGTRGGLVAGTLFVLPGFLAILGLSVVYAVWGEVDFVTGLFFGLQTAVLAIVVQAVVRVGKRVLKNRTFFAIAASAFVAIFVFSVPFPFIVLAAGALGFAGGRLAPRIFAAAGGHGTGAHASADGEPVLEVELREVEPSARRSLVVLATWGSLWFVPLAILAALFGRDDVLVQEGLFFSKAAVVTFGGAYAVLAYVAQQAVLVYGWLEPREMLVGLGMAETTPGPLIQVVQFVGFMGAWRAPGGLDPLVAGIAGSLVTTWVTFAPCFLWIFLGAPYVERLRGNENLTAALSAITAAVVGVILNLAVWFALHALFGEVDVLQRFGMRCHVPVWSTLDPAALALSALAFLTTFRFRLGMPATLGICAALGAAYWTAT